MKQRLYKFNKQGNNAVFLVRIVLEHGTQPAFVTAKKSLVSKKTKAKIEVRGDL